MAKEYIGDGVYIDTNGFHIVLTTEDGLSVTNRIFLEPQYISGILNYCERMGVIVKSEDVSGE